MERWFLFDLGHFCLLMFNIYIMFTSLCSKLSINRLFITGKWIEMIQIETILKSKVELYFWLSSIVTYFTIGLDKQLKIWFGARLVSLIIYCNIQWNLLCWLSTESAINDKHWSLATQTSVELLDTFIRLANNSLSKIITALWWRSGTRVETSRLLYWHLNHWRYI